ncbi:MAG: DEAD/DEAH box helicase [Micavibrio sp. TMED2]|nr:DEAD/DEAH box helicase [Alphaproteobacteria bacterium]MAS47987.1 DEAD/DEAH box helicase [Alphaproteobacteria bacterium]MAX97046.1 DEAD/DEAH box helicase [Alphaproteobacteria bacterium]MBN56229.1 DEAD/DEAH box helicase [Oceanospirillaceae bacterium]OUT40362.1 MAG: DEAD/DEAH box helicase [Micavibrio sp. TMED2]
MITDYHAKLFAYELLKRHSAADSEKLASALLDAQVDLNPHQVEAALFAFKSPLSKGAILADEVGLGKTIEAGLVLAQKWTEGRRRILVITPANLRKQWSQEIEEKFFLPTVILEAKNYNRMAKDGVRRPFEQKKLVICSFQFAARHADELMVIPWDLVVIDEAHRLRNVYRPDNRIGRTLKGALANVPKVLLTATPLQNSLMELYGLVSLIDDYAFGDAKSFRAQYARISGDGQFDDLKGRLKPVCHRTLRRQVLEYIRYTNRIPITQEFVPTEAEQALYDMVSDYLRRPSLQALPSSQRTLMTLIMRKLLASSTFAIAGALDTLARKLERQLKDDKGLREKLEEEIAEDYEEFDEIADEWSDGEEETELLTPEDIASIQREIDDLRAFRDLAVSISENAKGQALLSALRAGFAKTAALGGPEKAIIFTESRRTQEYLVRLLSEQGFQDKLVLFNGSNSDPQSKAIYEAWLEKHKGTDRVTGSRTADIRAALVEYFRETASIMIATEAAAEGINLQFCSIVVNYDLPWNPQRIEQRIGRCHRYGQKFDVVVVNFLNKNNAADQRVYELLAEKFQLFSGVFGASDEVLGAIESGVEFEKRIVSIYQNCRSTDEIESEFEQLRAEMEENITETMEDTRRKLLENFDAEVHDRLKINLDRSREYIGRYERMLWAVTQHELRQHARFDDEYLTFTLKRAPEGLDVPIGGYGIAKNGLSEHRYRLGHPLAQHVIGKARDRGLNGGSILFDYSGWPAKAVSIEPLVGRSGILAAHCLSFSGFDEQDHILFAAKTDDGQDIDPDIVRRLFEMPCRQADCEIGNERARLDSVLAQREQDVIEALKRQNAQWFADESQKLEKWAEDKVFAAEKELKDAKARILELKREARSAGSPEQQHRIQTQIQDLEKSKRRLRQRIFEVEDEIIDERDQMISDLEARLQQDISKQELFVVRWAVV